MSVWTVSLPASNANERGEASRICLYASVCLSRVMRPCSKHSSRMSQQVLRPCSKQSSRMSQQGYEALQ